MFVCWKLMSLFLFECILEKTDLAFELMSINQFY